MAKSGGTEKGIKIPDETSGFRMGKNYLLAIAIDEYEHCPQLSNCVKDAKTVIDTLQQQYRFEPEHTITLFDKAATRRNILRELGNLKEKVKKPDNLVIYFSGHGELRHMTGYWVPIEAEPDYIADFISTHDITTHLDVIDSLHTFLIVDACFSGSIFIQGQRKVITPMTDFTRPSRLGFSSSHSREAALDGKPGDNSPFTACLLQELRKNAGPLNASQLAESVSAEVKRKLKNQNPIFRPLDVKGDELGMFIFFLRQDESSDWTAANTSNTPEAYRQFLQKHPTSTRAEEAWWKLAALLNTSQAYEDYLDRFASGKYAKTAREALANQEEEEIWEEAQRRDVRSAYYDYLGKFPKGKYRERAQKRIEELRSRPESTTPPTIPEPVVLVPTQTASPTLPEGMILVPAGTFDMGDVMGDKEVDNELPVHFVTLDAFYLGIIPVTFDEYHAFCKATGMELPGDEGWGRGKRPVINVSWEDAVAYCNWRSKQEGLKEVYTINGTDVKANWQANGYRLPTEAEWEYAAREGGKKVRFGNGKDIADPKEINFDGSKEYKKPYSVVGEYRGKTVVVGSFSPNTLGLYDMSGNVWEWCWDWYEDYSSFAQTNPKGPSSGSDRVLRGGSWFNAPQVCRVAYRDYDTPGVRDGSYGFRLARTL